MRPLDAAREAGSEPDSEAEADTVEWRRFAVQAEEHGLRLDKVLAVHAPEFSRNHLQGLVESGHVLLDGQPQRTNARKLRVGQAVELALVPTAESLAYRPQPMALTIVHEDEHVLVVDKPAGLVVHPAAGNWSGTLLNGLLAHHPAAAALPRAGIVHRLDKDTSGLMVVGKTLEAVTALVRAIAARDVRRHYRALAWGRLEPAEQTLEQPIGRDPGLRTRMAVTAGGKPARTEVQRVAEKDGVSALLCRLHTGRTHQIRVHLAWRGHPLLADSLYGGQPALDLQRQALHAAHLSFEHPAAGIRCSFDCPPPADFAKAWAKVAGAA